MTELRQRMIECLQLRGLSERTQEAYVRAVRQLSEHYHKSPDQITEEELRQYFLYIKNVKHYARNTSTIAICGIKFFFEKTLNRDWATFGLLRAPRRKSCQSSSAIKRCARFSPTSGSRATKSVSPPSTPAACVCRKEPISTSPTSIAHARCCTCVTAKVPGIVISRFPNARSNCCASIGPRIAIQRYSFLPPAMVRCPLLPQPNRCTRAACKTLSRLRSKKAVVTSALQCTPCATPGPPICSKPASACDSFKSGSAIVQPPPPVSTPISPPEQRN